MTITELEELDRAFRKHLHEKAVLDTKRAIKLRAAQGAPTDALERHLRLLERTGEVFQ